MNLVVKNIIRFIIIMTVQLFVLNNVPPLHQFIVPYFYFVFLLWLPFKITRTALLFVAFAVGYVTDMFYKTPGLHLAACVLIAYVRPPFIQLLLPKEATEWGNEEPTRKTMGQVPYMTYVIIMTLIHHFYLILLEWLQFGSFFYFSGKLIGTSLISVLLIMIADLLFNRNTRTR
ncbi:MAG: hypothetical protein RL253_769 [Bacteroidota bacterium]|jgi:hypothetical protein